MGTATISAMPAATDRSVVTFLTAATAESSFTLTTPAPEAHLASLEMLTSASTSGTILGRSTTTGLETVRDWVVVKGKIVG